MTPKNPGALAVISPAETSYTTRERETVTGSGSKTLVYDANGILLVMARGCLNGIRSTD